MLTFITLGNNETYKVEGSGMAVVVMLISGSVDILDDSNNVLAVLDSEGEAYSMIDGKFTVKGKTSSNKIVIGSFPVLV